MSINDIGHHAKICIDVTGLGAMHRISHTYQVIAARGTAFQNWVEAAG
jgi:hypothetical protein